MACVIGLTACDTLRPVEVQQPMSARPVAPSEAARTQALSTGAIFQDQSYVPLFGDHRARHVGDTLTVVLNENLNATKQSGSNAQRNGSFLASTTLLPGAHADGTSTSKFGGKGDSASSNLFTGVIAVTVIEELSNGNLVVSGEKQIGINQGSEFIRFSGVVNPTTIAGGNSVSSTQVADARIEYRGSGYLDEAQTMGWLQRFFLSVLPF